MGHFRPCADPTDRFSKIENRFFRFQKRKKPVFWLRFQGKIGFISVLKPQNPTLRHFFLFFYLFAQFFSGDSLFIWILIKIRVKNKEKIFWNSVDFRRFLFDRLGATQTAEKNVELLRHWWIVSVSFFSGQIRRRRRRIFRLGRGRTTGFADVWPGAFPGSWLWNSAGGRRVRIFFFAFIFFYEIFLGIEKKFFEKVWKFSIKSEIYAKLKTSQCARIDNFLSLYLFISGILGLAKGIGNAMTSAVIPVYRYSEVSRNKWIISGGRGRKGGEL